MSENQIIKGEYVQQIFFADDSKYTIIRVELLEPIGEFSYGDFMTVTGTFNELALNHQYQFEGRIIEHHKYGHQFQAISAFEILPKERENVIHYLKNLKIKGIGTRTIEQLYDFFGENMLEIISKGSLHSFEGFHAPRWTDAKASELLEVIKEQQSHQTYFFELIKMGLPSHIVVQLQDKYEEKLKTIIEANSYQLLDDFDGISIKTVDNLVQNFFPEQIEYRITYAIVYNMKQYCYKTGGSAITYNELLTALHEDYLIIYPEIEIEKAIETLLEQKKVFHMNEYYMLDFFYHTEQTIAQRINELLGEKAIFADHESFIDTYIKHCEHDFGIEYAQQQLAAIKQALVHPVFLMTGGPGTGKTTIIRAILEIYILLEKTNKTDEKLIHEQIALLAPTGRAAQRMQETTGLPAKTIHRFLGWDLHSNSYRFNEHNPIKEVEFIIVDESSMIDMWLLASLLKAVPNLRQIIFVGDADQLPSVSNGQCFSDMLKVEKIKKAILNEIFRQKTNSTIIDISNSINEGKKTDLYFQQSSDYSFLEIQPAQLLIALEKICLNALNKGYDYFQIQVLAPLYKGGVGIDSINRHLQTVFNPDEYGEDERYIVNEQVTFLPNDKVIQLKNLPDFDVYNGDIGKIISIDRLGKNEYEVLIDFNGNLLIYSKEEMKLLRHAYCTSIHKAQGSEFQLVIMPIFFQYSIMLYRQLLYTGTSRAKKALIILGQKQALLQGVVNNREFHRKTQLSYFLSGEQGTLPDTIFEAMKQNVIGEELENITPWDFLA